MYRILQLNEEAHIAGAETSIINLALNLDRSTFTPVLGCPKGPTADVLIQRGIEHIPYEFRMRKLKLGHPRHSRIRLLNPFAVLQKVREGVELARIVRRQDIALIHSHSRSAHIAGLVAGRLAHVPVVWHVRSYLPRDLFRFWLPDRIISVSRATQDAVLGLRADCRARVIYNGQDTSLLMAGPIMDLRHEFGLTNTHDVATIIGRLIPSKGHEELLSAWRHVIAHLPSARLLVVGDELTLKGLGAGRYRGELEEMATALGIGDSVVFTGWREDILSILHSTDVLISPFYNDANPRTVLEGMFMGKAIIGVRSGGIPEMIVHRESGILLDNRDAHTLSQAILHLLGAPERRASLGQNARKRAVDKFSIERHVAEVEALYLELLVEAKN